jgi:ABC-type antimicrobial peptide transport system permease subunit
VLRQGVLLVAIGAMVGLAVAAPLAHLLASFLFGMPPLDPVTFGGAALLFFVTTVIAGCGPARRATRVDPLVALRHE